MTRIYAAKLFGKCSVLLLGILASVAWLHAANAMEPTPTEPVTGTPDIVTNEGEPVATRIIVKYVETDGTRLTTRSGALASARQLTRIAETQVRHVRTMSDNAQVIEVVLPEATRQSSSRQRAEAVQVIAERIAADPAVEYAEPDAIMQIQQSVNDPLYGQQWHYTRPATGVNVVGGWSKATGNGVVVAVIDTGSRPHADLAGNLLPGYDFITNVFTANDGNARDPDASDPGDWVTAAEIASRCRWLTRPRDSSWHGTHVAGTVAAVTNNATGVAGVARNARIVPVRVLGRCGGSLSDIADGMRWAAGLSVPGVPANPNPAKVLNLSLGGGGACGPTYQSAINQIVAAGVSVVVAAGNSNADAGGFRPANCNGVITVASTTQAGARAYYSNFGQSVEVAAPGGETINVRSRGVLSTLNTGRTSPGADSYAFYQGTSMAAPHVAGVVALIYELAGTMTPAQISTLLQTTAQPFPTVSSNRCTTSVCGAGIVDAGKAVDAISTSKMASMPWLEILLKN